MHSLSLEHVSVVMGKPSSQSLSDLQLEENPFSVSRNSRLVAVLTMHRFVEALQTLLFPHWSLLVQQFRIQEYPQAQSPSLLSQLPLMQMESAPKEKSAGAFATSRSSSNGLVLNPRLLMEQSASESQVELARQLGSICSSVEMHVGHSPRRQCS